jgi:hypothetical protein
MWWFLGQSVGTTGLTLRKPTFRRPSLSSFFEDEDRDGLRKVDFLTAQTTDPADGPRKLHHTQSPGKQQIWLNFII